MNIGLLGGCFNPVHNGHLRLAIETAEALGLSRVDLMPAAVPPHKSDNSMLPFELRCELCEAAVQGSDLLSVNRFEAELQGPSYTIETLEHWRAQRPGDALTFILGAADLLMLPQWKRGLEIPALCNLAVAGREGSGLDDVRDFVNRTWPVAGNLGRGEWGLPGGNILAWVPLARLDVSSSDIRQRWLEGRSLCALVPDGVEALLDKHSDAVREAWNG